MDQKTGSSPVVDFSFLFDFSTFPRGAGKSTKNSESRKIAAGERRGLAGFDLSREMAFVANSNHKAHPAIDDERLPRRLPCPPRKPMATQSGDESRPATLNALGGF